MRNVTLDNLTDIAAGSFKGLPDDRGRELVQKLVLALHAYARDVELTHAEWRGALAFLHRCADISSDSRSEFSLLSDVLGLSSLVDLMASRPGATPGSVLGPFHTVGSPWLDNPASLIGDNAGQRVVYLGPGVRHRWQALARGLPGLLAKRRQRPVLAGRRRTAHRQPALPAEGGQQRWLSSWPPSARCPTRSPPTDRCGTTSSQPAQRSSWRSAHGHVIVSAPGHRTLVTELFDADDTYLDNDAVFGVREALVGRFEPTEDEALCQRHGLTCSETWSCASIAPGPRRSPLSS